MITDSKFAALAERIFNAAVSVWEYLDDRIGLRTIWKHTGGHIIPRGTGWWYVFGTATLAAFILQVVTGIALATIYVPSTNDAYRTLQFITNQAKWGHLLRGLHFFGASAMILFVGIHLTRTYLMGAYKFPREMSWLSGSALLLLVLIMGFTGQLLRWDQVAYWSVFIAAEQMGRVPLIGHWIARFLLAGDNVSGTTLTRFFAYHVFFVPALIMLLIGAHLYLVLRNGISEPPKAGRPVNPKTYRAWYQNLLQKEGVPFWPSAAWRDVVFGVGMIVVLVNLAIFFGAPQLAGPPDPRIVVAEPRPDWYLLWYFGLLALIPPKSESVVMVLAPLAFGLFLILPPLVAPAGERSAWKRPWAIAAVFMTWSLVVSLWIVAKRAPWSPDFAARPLPASVIGSTSGPVFQGGQVFYTAGCEYCHKISGHGGIRGPDLSGIGNRLTPDELTIRIVNGARNMPAFGGVLSGTELSELVTFLETRKMQ